MKRSLGMMLGASLLILVGAAACGDDEGTTGSGGSGTGTATGTGTGTATGTGGMGGSGGTAAGTGGSGGAGGEACLSCGDLLDPQQMASLDQTCGFEGIGGMGPSCEADSSCQKFLDLITCICGAGPNPGNCNNPDANNSCADNACMMAMPDMACITCINTFCDGEESACLTDGQ